MPCIFTVRQNEKLTTLTMAPTPISPAAEQQTQQKRKPSYKITDRNSTGAKSNAVTKCLKLSSDTAQAAAAKHQQRQFSQAEDNDSHNSAPESIKGLKTPNALHQVEADSSKNINTTSAPNNLED